MRFGRGADLYALVPLSLRFTPHQTLAEAEKSDCSSTSRSVRVTARAEKTAYSNPKEAVIRTSRRQDVLPCAQLSVRTYQTRTACGATDT